MPWTESSITKVSAGSAPIASAANRNTSGAGLGLPVGVSSAENIRPSKKRFNPVRTSIASSRSVRELEQMQRLVR